MNEVQTAIEISGTLHIDEPVGFEHEGISEMQTAAIILAREVIRLNPYVMDENNGARKSIMILTFKNSDDGYMTDIKSASLPFASLQEALATKPFDETGIGQYDSVTHEFEFIYMGTGKQWKKTRKVIKL